MIIESIEDRVRELNSGKVKYKIDIFNERIKINENTANPKEILDHFEEILAVNKIEKILFISEENQLKAFLQEGFIMEAEMPGYFKGKTGYFLSKFLTSGRQKSDRVIEEDHVIEMTKDYKEKDYRSSIPKGYSIRNAVLEDAQEMAKLYAEVFETYPNPMDQPNYIQKVMKENVFFKVILYRGKIVSAASADMDVKNLNAEITDCATLPAHRGKGLMGALMVDLEKDLNKKGYLTLFTMARAISVGMNIAFARQNYKYTGRVIKNCNISGGFEDMNIWVKEMKREKR